MKPAHLLIKEFKSVCSIEIDFRKMQFLANEYGAYPQNLRYDDAEIIVNELYSWAQDIVDSNPENYPSFGGWQYNLSMTLNDLKTSKLKDLINDVCNSLWVNYVIQPKPHQSESENYWMVIGRDHDGEYPVKLNLTEEEAKELAAKQDGDVARYQGKKL